MPLSPRGYFREFFFISFRSFLARCTLWFHQRLVVASCPKNVESDPSREVIGRRESAMDAVENRLRRIEVGHTFALQTAKMGTWEVDLEAQTTSCSKEMLELWGMNPQEFSGQRVGLQDRVHKDDLQPMKAAIDLAIEQRSIYEHEFRIHPEPGVERWVSSRGQLVDGIDGTQAQKFCGVVFDITERKAREAKNQFLLRAVSAFSNAQTETEVMELSVNLFRETFAGSTFLTCDSQTYRAMGELEGQALERIRLSEQTKLERDHFRSFFALSSSGSVEIDFSTGIIQEANQRLTDITGYSRSELLGASFRNMVLSQDRSNYERETSTFEGRMSKVWRIECRLNRQDGEISWCILSGILIFNSQGLPLKYLMAVMDISELKKTEIALLKAIKIRDQFLSIASHELKTPLTSLQLQIQLKQRDLKRKYPEGFSLEKLENAFSQQYEYVRRIGHLVDDMLDASRIAEGRLSIRLAPFDLSEMVSEVIDRFQVTADAAGVAIETIAIEKVLGSWDRFRLEQVLVNLLTNALRYGNGRTIQVQVREVKSRAFLSVRDQGLGIHRSDQKRIFDRFERAVSENEISGLGLGLYICSEIVEAHGGEIILKSEIGEGSEFTVVIPLGTDALSTEAISHG